MVDLMLSASCLFYHDIDLITIVHLKRLWRVVVLDALSIEDESALIVAEALPLAVGLHQLLELSRLLNLEEYLRSVLGLHFDVQLLASCGWGGGWYLT